MGNDFSSIVSGLEISFGTRELEQMRLRDIQTEHAEQLKEFGVAARAMTHSEAPTSSGSHICVFRHIGMLSSQRVEIGGVRIQDRIGGQPPVNIPVYKLTPAKLEAVGHFLDDEAGMVSAMVASLSLKQSLGELSLSDDLTEIVVRVEPQTT